MKPVLAIALLALAACQTESGNAVDNGPGGNSAVLDQAGADAPPVNEAELAEANRMKLWLGQEGLTSGIMSLHPINDHAFGMPRAEIVAIVTRLAGPPTGQGRNAECGAGPIEFTRFGTFTLNFQEGRWVGWDLAGPPMSPPLLTAYDIGIGSPNAHLSDGDGADGVIRQTSLGTEFSMGGMHGLLTGPGPDGTVTRLWAGTTCAFR